MSVMPRDGAIIFSDLIGKLDVLRVSCEKCGRDDRWPRALFCSFRTARRCGIGALPQ